MTILKVLLSLIFLILTNADLLAQNESTKYDKNLADSLGADEYGMKMYVLVILKAGTNTIDNKQYIDSVFKGHMANIGRLAKEGKLIVAGPFKKNDKSYRGIFILNVKSKDEAKLLLETDPAVHSQVLDAELYEWYGSAALAKYLPFHQLIEKKSH